MLRKAALHSWDIFRLEDFVEELKRRVYEFQVAQVAQHSGYLQSSSWAGGLLPCTTDP